MTDAQRDLLIAVAEAVLETGAENPKRFFVRVCLRDVMREIAPGTPEDDDG